jgi:lactate permease
MVLGLTMGLVQYLVAVAGLWNIASFAGGMAGLTIAFPLARLFPSRARANLQPEGNGRTSNDMPDRRLLLVALSGYIALILITLGVQLIPAVNDWLGKVVIQLNFPEISTSSGFITPAGPSRKIVLFRHAGIILLYSSIAAYLLYKLAGLYRPGAVSRILDGTVRRVMPSSVSIVSMVAMAVLMEDTGMTDTLARGLAQGVGAFFPAVSPWIGALGAFMTGSNTNSNVVFAALQMHTAELLGFSIAIILAAQTAGGALASVIAPTKVVVGASTAGMAGKEGEVMRKLLPYIGLLLLLISLLTFIGIYF